MNMGFQMLSDFTKIVYQKFILDNDCRLVNPEIQTYVGYDDVLVPYYQSRWFTEYTHPSFISQEAKCYIDMMVWILSLFFVCRNNDKILGIDFGAHQEFLALHGKCFEYTDRE